MRRQIIVWFSMVLLAPICLVAWSVDECPDAVKDAGCTGAATGCPIGFCPFGKAKKFAPVNQSIDVADPTKDQDLLITGTSSVECGEGCNCSSGVQPFATCNASSRCVQPGEDLCVFTVSCLPQPIMVTRADWVYCC